LIYKYIWKYIYRSSF